MTKPPLEATPRKPLRLWPGVVAALLLLGIKGVLPLLVEDSAMIGILGGAVLGLVLLVWWTFFSRAAWAERLTVLGLAAVALLVTFPLTHVSIRNGMMGMMYAFYAVPVALAAIAVGAVAGRDLSVGRRRAWIAAALALFGVGMTLLRTEGVTGSAGPELAWRWTPTSEELLLRGGERPPPAAPPAGAPIAADAASEADWPGFRGPERDGVVRGARFDGDWSARPPVELWRRPVGPGWSSFAVRGDRFYTQEQRGEEEVVAAYALATGEPVWRHSDPVRFWESNAGAGPRATPTLDGERLYAFGATGILNALDVASGARLWSRDVAADTGEEIPTWGFSSSPVVVGDLVAVAAGGKLAAYDRATGEPRWFGPDAGGGYSSPQRATIDGVEQILLQSSVGLISVAPADGRLLWRHDSPSGSHIVQPAVHGGGDLLLGTTVGTDRLGVEHAAGGWSARRRWSSNGLKPYFNDFVVHEGHAYGIDGNHLACIELEKGARKWKGGRYGAGQLVLLAEPGLLLVVSERGDLALVEAKPDGFTERARVPGIRGKTWNHPVLAGDVLLVRNGEEMAAFRLPLAGG